jgi:hypothetical protein
MKVDPTGKARSTDVRRTDKAKAGKSGEFSRLLDLGGSEDVRAAAAAVPLESLVKIQDVADQSEERPRQRGEDILAKLEELRLGLLEGSIPRERLDGLVRLCAEQRGKVADPRLAEILDEIDLRARVELAKLSVQI